MASVTPGVLLKLLQSMNSPDSKILAEHHRSPVLQVTGIAPATSDLWPSPVGFYLQLSDSANSTYVFVSDRDADSIQLGQLVHLDRLLPSHPVPRAANLRPLQFLGRSPPPLLGNPQPLTVSVSSPSNPSNFLVQPADCHSAPPPVAAGPTRPVFASRENEIAAPPPAAHPKRRFSSPASAKREPSPAAKREPSPVAKGKSRASSPAPSKCVVPSLIAAKEENRRTAREPAIVVPSRYRQPSPVGGKRAASPVGKRGSMSPGGRRLSGGMKGASPGVGDGSGGVGKRKVGVVVAGISRVSDALMGSARSVRKSWEENSGGGSREAKEKEKVKSKVDQQAILRTQVTNSIFSCLY